MCDKETNPSRKRKNPNDNSQLTSKRTLKEIEIDDLTFDLKELHGEKYSEPQYRLWARMIINGLHSSKESPPNVPMITGLTPTRQSRRSQWRTLLQVLFQQQ